MPQSTPTSSAAGTTHLCISEADLLIPRHIKISRPVMARVMRKRVRVRSTTSALHGGNLALADFHVIPPFGRSIFAVIEQSLYGPADCSVQKPPNGHPVDRSGFGRRKCEQWLRCRVQSTVGLRLDGKAQCRRVRDGGVDKSRDAAARDLRLVVRHRGEGQRIRKQTNGLGK